MSLEQTKLDGRNGQFAGVVARVDGLRGRMSEAGQAGGGVV